MISVWADRMPRRTVRTIALVSYSLLLAGFALMREVLPAAVLLAAVGWAGVTTLTLTNTLLQMVVPDALRGRVMSVFVMLVMGVSQLSGLAVGAIAEAFDDVAHTVVVWTMLGWALQVVLAWLQWRGDRQADEAGRAQGAGQR
jgi:MFS family permease